MKHPFLTLAAIALGSQLAMTTPLLADFKVDQPDLTATKAATEVQAAPSNETTIKSDEDKVKSEDDESTTEDDNTKTEEAAKAKADAKAAEKAKAEAEAYSEYQMKMDYYQHMFEEQAHFNEPGDLEMLHMQMEQAPQDYQTKMTAIASYFAKS